MGEIAVDSDCHVCPTHPTSRSVRPAESPGHSCRQHFDNHGGGLPDALPGPGEEKGAAGGGGL